MVSKMPAFRLLFISVLWLSTVTTTPSNTTAGPHLQVPIAGFEDAVPSKLAMVDKYDDQIAHCSSDNTECMLAGATMDVDSDDEMQSDEGNVKKEVGSDKYVKAAAPGTTIGSQLAEAIDATLQIEAAEEEELCTTDKPANVAKVYRWAHEGIDSEEGVEEYGLNKIPACFLKTMNTSKKVILRAYCILPFKDKQLTKYKAEERFHKVNAHYVRVRDARDERKWQALIGFERAIKEYIPRARKYHRKGVTHRGLSGVLSKAARCFTRLHPEWAFPKVMTDYTDFITVHQ